MTTLRIATVVEVREEVPGRQRLRLDLDGSVREAILYTALAVTAQPGHRVVVNTTAVDLGLGTGGADFVVWNLDGPPLHAPSGGHIMKLRYTPLQADVMAVEAPESPHHEVIASADGLDGMPVVAASLHSQVLPVVCALRHKLPDARLAYVMTDGAGLMSAFSDTARRLRELGWLAGVVTCGHAMGGDLEAVNVYSALLACKEVLAADAAVVAMGPGVVGTQTRYGTTALELGTTINAVAALGGRPVACVRMSSGDPRERHAGLSDHVEVALRRVALAGADVPVPVGHGHIAAAVGPAHRVLEVDTSGVIDAIRAAEDAGLHGSHMGRGPDADPLFFEAAGGCGYHVAGLLQQSR